MNKWKKVFQTATCIVMIMTMISYSFFAFADEDDEDDAESTKQEKTYGSVSDITSDSIEEKEGAISNAQQEKDALQSGLTNVKQIVKDLESTKSNLKDYVTQLDSSLKTIEEKLEELNALIEKKEEEIKKTQEELDNQKKIEEKQYASMKYRIKLMYERGDSAYLDMLLQAKSFGEFLNKTDYILQISAYDRKMLTEYQETVAAIQVFENQLQEEQEILEEAKVQADSEKASLNTLIGEKEQQITAYDSDITNKEQLIKEYEAEIAQQNAEIAALEKAVQAEKARIAEENGLIVTYDGGKFAWPAPSYTRISSEYGNRMHPTLGIEKFHNGIDMAAPSGSPILAAYDGSVVEASYSSTMGNYVMIDHGDNLYTIYMHASALHVSKGAVVTRGQQIASVGSTGRSTGPHLHFSVRLNGGYANPRSYL